MPAPAFAQANNVRSRITLAVDDAQTTVLRGNTHPSARPEFDRGAAPGNLPMENMLLVLKRSPEQEAALEKLMAEQQDHASPNFHKWLTPAQFGQEFGPSDQDIQTITRWLESHGFQVASVSTGRTVIQFSGNAAQVQEAFHTSIHNFVVNGESHWANASDPSIPTALAPVVAGVNTLHNFFPKPMSHVVSAAARSSAGRVRPQVTLVDGQGNDVFAVGPADFATIYNVAPLWNSGIDGTGVTIAIVGDSNIDVRDIQDFRSLFGVPLKDPVVTIPPGGSDPGKTSDEVEADLDIEWSGAVARNADINLVISQSSFATFGGDLSAQYIVNFPNPTHTNTSTGLAPILSESFGICELAVGTAQNAFYNSTWQQAASEGITVLVSSGDQGSAACDPDGGTQVQTAKTGLAVNGIASTPNNVAVGGTEFDDPNPLLFWSGTPTAQGSALSYIPEMTYNDSCTNAVVYTAFGFSGANAAVDACNNSTVQSQGFVLVVGGSGGVSNCTSSSNSNPSTCTGGYPKPAWQQSGVTPNDGKRDLPDVSMFAGDGAISGSFYIACERDFKGIGGAQCSLSGNNPAYLQAGGTSVSAQVFAGIMALVVQQAKSAQGNANPTLYALATTVGNTCASNANPSPSCVFYDVTFGTNSMPCTLNTPNCSATSAMLGPAGRLDRNLTRWAWASTGRVALACAFLLGIFAIGFRGNRRLRSAALALIAFALLFGSVSCGGGSGGGGGGGGSGGGNTIGVLTGYDAATGYDLATGLGSVNANQLVTDPSWK